VAKAFISEWRQVGKAAMDVVPSALRWPPAGVHVVEFEGEAASLSPTLDSGTELVLVVTTEPCFVAFVQGDAGDVEKQGVAVVEERLFAITAGHGWRVAVAGVER
jgi:hypothetical protein